MQWRSSIAALALPMALILGAGCGGKDANSEGSAGVGGGSGGAGAGAAGAPGGAGAGGVAGASGAAGAAGTGGARAGGGADGGASDAPRATDAGSADAFIADRGPNAAGILIHVKNGCPFDLWIHGAGQGAVLMPDNARLVSGASQDYVAPDAWPAARVTAYLAAPNAAGQRQNEIDKVEMTLGNKVINYNITYVDWVGLPVEMVGMGTGSDCKKVGCYVRQSEILTSCPAGLAQGMRCLSAGSHCGNRANQAMPYCHALDAKIAECAGNAQKYPS